MAKKKGWYPRSLADQYAMFTNILAKISGYQLALGLSAALLAEIEQICQNFVAAYDWVESIDATKQAATQWRDLLYDADPEGGQHVGEPLPDPPVFAVLGTLIGVIGIVPRFKEIRAQIVKLDGYTEGIGEDLMIEGPEVDDLIEGEVSPELKVSVELGYKVNIRGSLQGLDAMRIEYKPVGGEWSVIAFLTKTPAQVVVTPQTPGQPESGHIRAVFMKDNQQFGLYSPEFAVTVS